MSRKLLILITLSISLAALVLAPLTPQASAQGVAQCPFSAIPEMDPVPLVEPTATASDESQVQSAQLSIVLPPACADATPYPGPFTNHPAAPVGPYDTPLFVVPSADQVSAIETQDTSPEIAHSGSESFILAYIGTGLVAFGAVALGSRRRLFVEQG